MKNIDFSKFEVADYILLDKDEKLLLAGLKGSKSLFTEQLSDYYTHLCPDYLKFA